MSISSSFLLEFELVTIESCAPRCRHPLDARHPDQWEIARRRMRRQMLQITEVCSNQPSLAIIM